MEREIHIVCDANTDVELYVFKCSLYLNIVAECGEMSDFASVVVIGCSGFHWKDKRNKHCQYNGLQLVFVAIVHQCISIKAIEVCQ